MFRGYNKAMVHWLECCLSQHWFKNRIKVNNSIVASQCAVFAVIPASWKCIRSNHPNEFESSGIMQMRFLVHSLYCTTCP